VEALLVVVAPVLEGSLVVVDVVVIAVGRRSELARGHRRMEAEEGRRGDNAEKKKQRGARNREKRGEESSPLLLVFFSLFRNRHTRAVARPRERSRERVKQLFVPGGRSFFFSHEEILLSPSLSFFFSSLKKIVFVFLVVNSQNLRSLLLSTFFFSFSSLEEDRNPVFNQLTIMLASLGRRASRGALAELARAARGAEVRTDFLFFDSIVVDRRN